MTRLFYWFFITGIVGYTSFIMVRSIHKSFLMSRKIETLAQDIERLKVANENQKNLLVYYQTKTFQELEARERLALKKPGEKVFIIPKQRNLIDVPAEDLTIQERLNHPNTSPNYQKWWQFIWQGNSGD